MKLAEASIKHPVSVIVGVFFVVLFGMLALFSIPVQLTPDITRPQITVTTVWQGASPQEIEREIVDRQEEYLKSVEGLTRLTSESRDSRGRVTLEFSVGTDIDAALLKVSTKLDQVPSYPDDADKPVLVSASENAPPIAYMVLRRVRADASPVYTLRNFAEDYIQPRLERVPGIAKINVYGGREEEMQVVFDEIGVAARKLTIGEIAQAMSAGNQNVSAGSFDEGKRRYVARTQGEYLNPKDAQEVVIKYVGGVPVSVKDVAHVRYGFKKQESVTRHKGEATLVMNAIRQAGSNVLQVMAGLKEGIAELNETILAERGLQLEQVYDETLYINSAIDLVRQNLFVGGALAIMVLLLFLRSFSSTFIVTLAIPISIIGTFLMLVLFGRTINVISLAGCAFAAGLVVDNSIVVLENIYRHRQMGESRVTAALSGTKEVWGAILASTLTTLAVFLPVIFVEEEVGQLFKDIAVTICFAVFLSLMVAITVIPSLSSRIITAADWDREGSRRRWGGGLRGLFGLTRAAEWFAEGVAAFVYWVCGRFLTRLMVVTALVCAAVGMAWFLAPQADYLPEGNRNMILGIVIPPPGYSIDEYEAVGKFVEEELRKYWEADGDASLDGPPIDNVFFVAYGQRVFMGASTKDPLRAKELIPILKRILRSVPGMITVVKQTSLFARATGAGRSIDVDISGPHLPGLMALAQRVFGDIMGRIPDCQLRPIPSLDLGNPEMRIIPDRDKAARVGLTAQEIGVNVDALLDGYKVGEVRRFGSNIDLTLMGRENTITGTHDFETLQLNTPLGNRVTLGSVATVALVAGPAQINHIERLRSVTIQVIPPKQMPLARAMAIIRNQVVAPLAASGELKAPYIINLSGTADDLTQTRKALQGNFLLALVITFMLLAALFESFLYPLVIMFSVPLAAAGGFLGLDLMNRFIAFQPLDVLTMLGFVILIGVVVNNAILIVHQALNFMREMDLPPREAIRQSVRTRIRPIFMSAFTSVMGMLPLILFPGAGSELYRGLGSVIVGGLIVSTVFTLFLVPSLFSLVMDARIALGRKVEGRRAITPKARPSQR
ncbi:MAG: efflux RND transporter permease subunit [Deltaproteobacteria bacterium]|nr:efflux RND transporter permease subunit [Deltaproteobacteria bacterium]